MPRPKVKKYRRRNNFPVKTIVMVVAVIFLAAAIYAFNHHRRKKQYDDNTKREAVSKVAHGLLNVDIPANLKSKFLPYEAMVVDFNPERHIPNYVAWELTREKASGHVSRKDKFTEDTSVEGCATLDDYKNSGYDRGHMCPAGDAKWSIPAMESTFYLTNICPQANALNTGSWKSLEEKCRTWAMADSCIIIVCGPVMTDRMPKTIGKSHVSVPERFFKVILSPYADPPQAIGFIMPNKRVPGGMQACAMSVDEVEAITGYDFFSALPDNIENAVESQCNFHAWSTKK